MRLEEEQRDSFSLPPSLSLDLGMKSLHAKSVEREGRRKEKEERGGMDLPRPREIELALPKLYKEEKLSIGMERGRQRREG